MRGNLGETRLRGRWRARDPMKTFDTLPTPLRHWLSQAVLPWSPASAHKIWSRAQAKGLSGDEALAMLERAELKTLMREKETPHWATPQNAANSEAARP